MTQNLKKNDPKLGQFEMSFFGIATKWHNPFRIQCMQFNLDIQKCMYRYYFGYLCRFHFAKVEPLSSCDLGRRHNANTSCLEYQLH